MTKAKIKNLIRKYKFYCDENFPEPSAKYLKNKGFSLVHAHQIKYVSTPQKEIRDEQQLEKARSLKRILLSLDLKSRKFLKKYNMTDTGIVLFSITDPSRLNSLIDKFIKAMVEKKLNPKETVHEISANRIKSLSDVETNALKK